MLTTRPQAIVRSRLAPYVVDAARVIVAMAPHELKEGSAGVTREVKYGLGAGLPKGDPQTGPGKERA